MAKIQWPISPTVGQIYTSPNGDYFIFDGCAWLHTCCPNECNIRSAKNNLIVAITFLGAEIPYVDSPSVSFLVPFTYEGSDKWSHTSIVDLNGNTITFTISQNYGSWFIRLDEEDFIASISGEDPVGTWTMLKGEEDVSIFSYCGTSTPICLIYDHYGNIFKTVSMIPVVFNQDYSSPIIGYFSFRLIFILWDNVNNQWVLFGNEGLGNFIGYLPGVPQTSLPVGTGWIELGYESGISISTVEGICECDNFINGITITVISIDGETPVTQKIYFSKASETTWNSPQLSNVYIEFDGSVYKLYTTEPSVVERAFSSDLSTWTITNPYGDIFYESISSVCGSPINSAGCLIFTRSGTTYNISMSIVKYLNDKYIFIGIPEDGEEFYIFNDNSQWIAVVNSLSWGEQVIGTVVGDSTTPPYEQNFVQDNDLFKNIYFIQGLCN